MTAEELAQKMYEQPANVIRSPWSVASESIRFSWIFKAQAALNVLFPKPTPQPTPTPWRKGIRPDCVVADVPIDGGCNGTGDVEYYGGYLICESVTEANADRIIEAVNAFTEAKTMKWYTAAELQEKCRLLIYEYTKHEDISRIVGEWLADNLQQAFDKGRDTGRQSTIRDHAVITRAMHQHKQEAQDRVEKLVKAAKAVIAFYGASGGPLGELRKLVGE